MCAPTDAKSSSKKTTTSDQRFPAVQWGHLDEDGVGNCWEIYYPGPWRTQFCASLFAPGPAGSVLGTGELC